MKKRFFGTDGIRGKVGEYPITPDFMLKLGWAVGRVLSKGRHEHVLIGKDTRISGYMMESVIEAGLAAAGVNVQLVGPMPTPGIAYLTRAFRASAGIVISASHNPHYDNGIKFFSAQGMKLADDIEYEIERQIDQPMTVVDSNRLGKATRINDAAGRYIEFCKSTIPARIEFGGSKIVVDCAHGSGYHIAPYVLEELGATVVKLGTEPNGLNINDGCGSTQPEKLQQTVIDEKADFGIALDGDGDRLIMVDHLGEIVDGDELIYIIAKSRQQSDNVQSSVVGTLMTNLGLEHALTELGLQLERAAVGDRYVMELMQRHGSVLGGENSGHIICLDRTTTGDATVSALQVMAEMWRSRESLNTLKKGMEKYPQKLVNVSVAQAIDIETLKPVQDTKREIEGELGSNGRVLLRPSGTEPLIRVMVEGRDSEMVDQMAHRLADVVSVAMA